MSVHQEIQGWLKQINAEVTQLGVLLDGEDSAIETVQLVVQENVEVKAGSLQAAGIVQAGDSVHVGDLSLLVENFSRRLKESADAVSKDFREKVKGAPGDQGLQGETGSKGPTGDAGNQGPQGVRGNQGEIGNSGSNRAIGHHLVSTQSGRRCSRCNYSEVDPDWCEQCQGRHRPGVPCRNTP